MWKEKSPVAVTDDSSSYSDDSDSDDAIHISEDEGSDPSDVDDDDDEYASPSKRVRIISWRLDDNKMVPGRCRWTLEQEKRLQAAQQQLARCQKAWSSEQEVWLKHVCYCPVPYYYILVLCTSFCALYIMVCCTYAVRMLCGNVLTHTLMQIEKLHEEKAAHEDFVQLRAKQQQDERVHFRKALKRREQEQGGDSGMTSDEDEGGLRRNQSLSRLRRLRRFS